MRAAQGDYQALAKLAAEEPRLTRLKVRYLSKFYINFYLYYFKRSAMLNNKIALGKTMLLL